MEITYSHTQQISKQKNNTHTHMYTHSHTHAHTMKNYSIFTPKENTLYLMSLLNHEDIVKHEANQLQRKIFHFS